jgi:rod shape-determining protein MreD
MNRLRNVLLMILALLVQSTVFGRMDFFGIRPDLAMLVLIFVASGSETAECTLYGFFIGFLQDVYTPEFLGYNAFAMTMIGFSLGILRETLTVENYGVKTLATFLACLAHDIIYLCFYTALDFSLFWRLFLKGSIAGGLYTSILAVLFFSGYEWITGGGLRVVIRELIGIRK